MSLEISNVPWRIRRGRDQTGVTVEDTRGSMSRSNSISVEDLTRRRFMASAFAVLFLAHNGSDLEDDRYQADQREIQDAFGTVTLPERPERVVAVRHHHIGNMLALGVTPVGIVPDASEFPFPGHAEALEGVANVRAETDWILDIEKALALNPDLILEMRGRGRPLEPGNVRSCQGSGADRLLPLRLHLRGRDQAEHAGRRHGVGVRG